ncbi:MAG: transketolase [Bacteroidota bacterium]
MAKDLSEQLMRHANNIRRHVIEMGRGGKAIHLGGAMSAADILSCLYFAVLNHRPGSPYWPGRDRFILSKGHAAVALYATLAEAGYFPAELLSSFKNPDSPLQGHPDMTLLPGVEMSTGSLGQGLSVAVGLGIAGRLDNARYRVYVMLGDGELDEGQVWEAALAASHFKLDNITAVIDRNGLQLDGVTEDIMGIEPLGEKWRAFGWSVIEADGHDLHQLLDAFAEAKGVHGRPAVIVARTVKGRGVPFAEGKVGSHSMKLSEAQIAEALAALEPSGGGI